MAYFKNIVFLLAVLLYPGGTKAEHCTPGIVPNIAVSAGKNLQWSTAMNPANCTISGYIIDVFDSEDGSQFQFQTASDVLVYNISFLDMCKNYSFEVHALTDQNILGPSEILNATIPPPENMNLSLNVNSPKFLNTNQIELTWNPQIKDEIRCISYYRIVYWDETNSPKDIYVTANNFSLIENLVACMNYTFQVSAVVTNPDLEGPTSEVTWHYSDVTDPPKLVNIISSNTTANMTWKVPSYLENRCQLTALVVYTLGLPTNSSTTRIPIQDSALRPNVGVYLKGLTPNTVYMSQVSLQNTAGYSKNVTVTFQTSDSFVFSYEKDLIYN